MLPARQTPAAPPSDTMLYEVFQAMLTAGLQALERFRPAGAIGPGLHVLCDPAPRLTSFKSDIVGACVRMPHKAETIARLIGRRCDSYFRRMLTELSRDGLLRRVEGGYLAT